MDWIETRTLEPPEGIIIIGYSPEWIHPDFNEAGIRECFLDGSGRYTSAKWCDYQDTYVTDTETMPTHWQYFPKPPTI